MEVLKEQVQKILPNYSVPSFFNDGVDVEWWSPAGEDIYVSLHGKTMRELSDYAKFVYEDFDPDDHAAIIYHAKHYGSGDQQRFYAGAPSKLTDLVEDAEEIKAFYKDVWERLEAAASSTP